MTILPEVDLTDIIAKGDISQIIAVLCELRDKGYLWIHWDGYDSSICALKVGE